VRFERSAIAGIASAIARIEGRCAIVADACCGLPLLEAGDLEGFAERATAMSKRLAPYERVVATDAGCAHVFRTIYSSFGLPVPPVRHVAESAAAGLASIPPLRSLPHEGLPAYHDACRLGRGLHVYDEPRAVLTRLLGAPPIELPERRERAACSGGGAILPLTRPQTAQGIAVALADLVRESGASWVVTGCAATRRQLARAGVASEDLAALVARALT
jgi:Fe-S oxidoreductase